MFTSSDAKGLIYDVLAVNPVSFAQHKDDWAKVVRFFTSALTTSTTRRRTGDAIKIMAAKAGADAEEYAKNVPGTHFLPLAGGEERLSKRATVSIRSMAR